MKYSYQGNAIVGTDEYRGTIIFPVHPNERQDQDVTFHFSKDDSGN